MVKVKKFLTLVIRPVDNSVICGLTSIEIIKLIRPDMTPKKAATSLIEKPSDTSDTRRT